MPHEEQILYEQEIFLFTFGDCTIFYWETKYCFLKDFAAIIKIVCIQYKKDLKKLTEETDMKDVNQTNQCKHGIETKCLHNFHEISVVCESPQLALQFFLQI